MVIDMLFHVAVALGVMVIDMLFHVAVAFGVMVIDMLFHVAVTFGVMMRDVLFHSSLVVMTIPPAMMVSVPVWIPFVPVPSVMMSMECFVAVVIAFVIMVSFSVTATIRPSVAPQGQ